MDQTAELILLVAAAALGIGGTLAILRRDRLAREGGAREGGARESTFAVSTEGMLRCPGCGMGNLVGDRTCSSCGKTLPH